MNQPDDEIGRGLPGHTVQTVAEMFLAFLWAEKKKLDEYKVDHGPTIGAMYEGLSAELLNRAMPKDLGLRVVSGFVVDHENRMSGQLDCMLVRGVGEPVPYTQSYKWPIWDVLAVFEVKKSLAKADLRDSFFHLRGVYDLFRGWIDSDSAAKKGISIKMAYQAYQMMTGTYLDSKGLTALSPERQLLHYTLVAELLSPVRVVWGYGGYKTEAGLRAALWDFVAEVAEESKVAGAARLGVPVFPQLISCNGISILKSNGQPYISPLRGEKWDFLLSSQTNPAWLLLELIWTKISTTFELRQPFPDGLEAEALNAFIAGEVKLENEDVGGWYLTRVVSKDVDFDKEVTRAVAWAPVELTEIEYVLILMLSGHEFVDTTDAQFQAELARVELAAQHLVEVGLCVMDGTRLRTVHDAIHTVITPDGRYLASSNGDQLSAYITTNLVDKTK